jgi:hypothetical protein
MATVQSLETEQFNDLTTLLEAEHSYHLKCGEIMDELFKSWPAGSVNYQLLTIASI